jgi:hypothetical protein
MKINRGGNDEIKKGIKDIKSTYYSVFNGVFQDGSLLS